MKNIFYTFLLFTFVFASCRKDVNIEQKPTVDDIAKTITIADLQKRLNIIASADMEGRNTPSAGLEKAAVYITTQLDSFGVKPGNNGNYRFNYIAVSPASGVTTGYSAANIIGLVEGTDKKDEYVVVCAHYDHVGINAQGNIVYGADDNGSGTSGLLEIAEAFGTAKKKGLLPRRSIIFLAVSGEEKGLWGSAYYCKTPTYPLEKTSAAVNMDMIGRIATDYLADKDSVNYTYVIGENKLSSEITSVIDSANMKVNLKLDKKYNDPADPNRVFYRSDQYSFAVKGVPVVFYFSGFHPDYHTPADTVDKIAFGILAKRVQLAFYTVWNIANKDAMLKRDLPAI